MKKTIIEEAKENALCITTQASGSIDQIEIKFKINSDSDYEKLIAVLKNVKKMYVGLEGKRKAIVTPINTAKNEVQSLFKPELDKLKSIEKEVKKEISIWLEKKEKEEQEEQAKLIAEAEFLGVDATIVEKVKPGGIITRTGYNIVIENESLLPREYLVPDIQKIKKIATATSGMIKIKGVVITEKKVIVNR